MIQFHSEDTTFTLNNILVIAAQIAGYFKELYHITLDVTDIQNKIKTAIDISYNYNKNLFKDKNTREKLDCYFILVILYVCSKKVIPEEHTFDMKEKHNYKIICILSKITKIKKIDVLALLVKNKFDSSIKSLINKDIY